MPWANIPQACTKLLQPRLLKKKEKLPNAHLTLQTFQAFFLFFIGLFYFEAVLGATHFFKKSRKVVLFSFKIGSCAFKNSV